MVDTLIFDQVHLGVPDPKTGAEWYGEHLRGTPGDHFDRVMFGPTRFIFLKNDTPAPSDGSAIDHVGFSVPRLEAEIDSLKARGVRVVSGINEGVYRSVFVEDPWGGKIEIVEDPDTLGFHHVHLQVPDPAASRQWYLERFGGRQEKLKGTVDGLRYGDVWIFMGQGAAAPSKGHTHDHIGYRMDDLMAKAEELRKKDVRFTTEPEPGPARPGAPVFLSFTEDPWGVKIELLQRP
jgi:catechol 2,3-dioxygenase-like lactoylglutathione lyase family enzyme